MKSGISQKLTATYLVIVVTMIVSGLFCFYVLDRNQRANQEMRNVTLPSIDHLEELTSQNRELKKLVSTRVFISASRDQDRLGLIVTSENTTLIARLNIDVSQWQDIGEKNLFRQIDSVNRMIFDSVQAITWTLKSPESYFNDALVDKATNIYNNITLLFAFNDKLLPQLIKIKGDHLEEQQNSVVMLQRFLYLALLSTLLVVVAVSVFSWQYSRKNVVAPLLKLEKTIQDLTKGIVDKVPLTERTDEIGKMQNAISGMIEGVIRKIEFAGKLGTGAYDAGFSLLSDRDELGIALLTMRDELRKSNDRLKEHERRLMEAQRMAKMGNYFVDVATGKVQGSETLDEIFGLTDPSQKKLSNWLGMIAPDFRDDFVATSQKAYEEHKLLTTTFKVLRASDGEERWVELIGNREYGEDGKPKYLFGTVQDINESKVLEQELNRSYKIATEQNKRLLNFSYIVSHNLRMHAVNIHSLLKMVAETTDPAEVQEFLTMLNTASEMLNETMHHLNDVVALQNAVSVEVLPLKLNTHIQHALTVLSTPIAQKNAIIVNQVDDEVVVNYNPAYLDSVVLNFISNAIKYSKPDIQPEVHIYCERLPAAHEHAKWVLIISDNGIGIDLAKNGSKLFGMYKTFHTNADSKGIGLFLTKYQIESMGGSIEVESELGKGTTFRIYFK